MSKGDERLCVTGEVLVYAAMSRLMVRRLARCWALLDSLSGFLVSYSVVEAFSRCSVVFE
jgi:hypothetical protein